MKWRCLLTVFQCLLLLLAASTAVARKSKRKPRQVWNASAVTFSSPFSLFDKRQLCQRDFKGFNKVINLINIEPEPLSLSRDSTPAPMNSSTKYPRIFCYVTTISPYHQTKAQLVADTWAQRCDKTVFFSNDTGVITVNPGTSKEISFPVIKMDAPADYKHLWVKQKEVLNYIHDHYRHDYDWIYKADDDAYVVVDNLRAYLRRPEIVNNYKRQPMQLGRRFNMSPKKINRHIGHSEENRTIDKAHSLKTRWWAEHDRWVFNSGGPGYAMNRLFLDKFVASMKDRKCFSEWETAPEDTAVAFCMTWYDATPWDTRDLHGRPRWHHFHPADEWDSKEKRKQNMNKWVGGTRYYEDCCARDSIGFHYIKGPGMYHMERMLYFCRTGDDVLDVDAFNAKYELAISDRILAAPPT